MAYVKKRSVLPIYFVGLTWLAWAWLLGLPLYRPTHYIIVALLSVIAYHAGKMIFPDRGYEVQDAPPSAHQAQPRPEPETGGKPKSTGNPEIDALLSERDRAVGEMRRLNASIEDPKISAQISRLEETTGKIIDTVAASPSKLPQIRKFMSYYLPTTLKLLNAYDRMDAAGVSGENISGTKEKVENIMGTIVSAFEKQLDGLFGADAMDISTDISVLETMLAREGLAGEKMEAQTTKNADGTDIRLEL